MTIAEMPPYAQPTTSTRCGDDSDIPPIASVRFGSPIVEKVNLIIGVRGI